MPPYIKRRSQRARSDPASFVHYGAPTSRRAPGSMSDAEALDALKTRCAKYGISVRRFLEMILEQDSACKICTTRSADPVMDLVIDHDHDTGDVRGLLCTPCNAGLGFFRDDAARMMSAAQYLVDTGSLPKAPTPPRRRPEPTVATAPRGAGDCYECGVHCSGIGNDRLRSGLCDKDRKRLARSRT